MNMETEMYLVDRLEDAMRGRSDPAIVIHKLKTIRDDDINRIWSLALQRMTWPPPNRAPWWRRIWSFFMPPTPDHKPGGPWR